MWIELQNLDKSDLLYTKNHYIGFLLVFFIFSITLSEATKGVMFMKNLSIHLFLEAICKFLSGVLLLGCLLFIPAGTVHWKSGWILMGILFIPMFIAGLFMMVKNPALLKSRLDSKEKVSAQKTVVKQSALMFIAGLIVSGLSYRYQFGILPESVSLFGCILFLISYALYAEVLRENTWLSRTIQVQDGQTVVDSGLYGIVRHPMYAITLVLFLSMPLILRSLPGFLVFLVYPFIIASRIRSEEQFLNQNLPGYTEYTEKVRYRLIPYLG